jgi:hypothetical protein
MEEEIFEEEIFEEDPETCSGIEQYTLTEEQARARMRKIEIIRMATSIVLSTLVAGGITILFQLLVGM